MTRLAVWPRGDGGGRTAAWWPWSIVAAAVAWNLVSLRAETVAVPYLNDSSVHEQMVRVATAQLRAGHLPLTSWFSYLGLGSPQFLHYQSLPAMLTGLLGLLIGPDPAFRWSSYLLLSLWPVSVYAAARLFGAGRPAAAASAAMSPFLAGATGVGYEQHAYLWIGYGVWTQLWASVTLPLAWGFGWRAIREGRGYSAAVALVSLTIAFHYETGYLAMIPLVLWPLVAGRRWLVRLRRGAIVLVGSLLAAAWVIVPLIAQRDWAATNEILRGTALENGYGAGRVLGWLASGQLLDDGRLPVITVFAAIGLVLACLRWRADPASRALLVALGACLLLSFGRATFGVLIDAIPGSTDIFFRRFIMGIQLAALLLAGRGAASAAAAARGEITRWWARSGPVWPVTRYGESVLVTLAALAAAALVLFPAWRQLGSYDRTNAQAIAAQQHADATQGRELDQLIAVINGDGGGRIYAGMPSNWGAEFTVGQVPVFKYLESQDVDEVGYTLRTASLMTDPEYDFDQNDPSDYRLFAIHYLILPADSRPPVPARRLTRAGPYALWTLADSGYVQVGTIVGSLTANRTNIGTRSIPVLHGHLAQHDEYLRVAFDHPDGTPAHAPSSQPPADRVTAGRVNAERDRLSQGTVTATVTMHRTGVVALSASYDPGWTATVDGKPRHTEMVAPALVATTVPAGTHRVVFRYRGFSGYPLLFAVSAGVLLALLCAEVARRHTPAPSKPRRLSQTAGAPPKHHAKPAPETHGSR
jgi:hypothetical protein